MTAASCKGAGVCLMLEQATPSSAGSPALGWAVREPMCGPGSTDSMATVAVPGEDSRRGVADLGGKATGAPSAMATWQTGARLRGLTSRSWHRAVTTTAGSSGEWCLSSWMTSWRSLPLFLTQSSRVHRSCPCGRVHHQPRRHSVIMAPTDQSSIGKPTLPPEDISRFSGAL